MDAINRLITLTRATAVAQEDFDCIVRYRDRSVHIAGTELQTGFARLFVRRNSARGFAIMRVAHS